MICLQLSVVVHDGQTNESQTVMKHPCDPVLTIRCITCVCIYVCVCVVGVSMSVTCKYRCMVVGDSVCVDVL